MEDMIKANTSRLGSDVSDIQGRIEDGRPCKPDKILIGET